MCLIATSQNLTFHEIDIKENNPMLVSAFIVVGDNMLTETQVMSLLKTVMGV